MAELTAEEKRTLLEAAKKVRTYKTMQAMGYQRLIRKAANERIRQLLAEISANESTDVESWSKRIEQLADGDIKLARAAFLNKRVGLMMAVLGTRGFFEWTIVAEDESIEDLSIKAGNLADMAASETWTRIASDERLHIERMKEDVLGMEGWEMGDGGGVREIILGANDGLVSILALVAGVYGAITEGHVVLVAGAAGAIAGAISMGAGAYLSSKSEKEVTEREREREGTRKRRTPEEEREELVRFYQERGFKMQEAEAVADRVALEMESRAIFTVGEELGLTSEQSCSPAKAAALVGLSFAIVSLVPILPFAFMEATSAAIVAVIASVVSLFGVGASKAIFTRKSWLRSGAEMMAIGTLAAAATYAIGLAIPIQF
ncbi:MAG: VIT1/CCC1 transporter family protein [Dehalococcoidia bacterium]